MSVMGDSTAPETHFHLAEALYRLGNTRGALERYYIAVEQDHEYVEAWTQIGCLHRELDEPHQALVAFEIALDVHGDYPDAQFHKAETLADLNRIAEAAPFWKAYLQCNSRGPSAEIARQRLADCGHL
jgi:tetratricopeptide (TPR) repeat protein